MKTNEEAKIELKEKIKYQAKLVLETHKALARTLYEYSEVDSDYDLTYLQQAYRLSESGLELKIDRLIEDF